MELLTSLGAAAALRLRNVALGEEAAERRRLEGLLATLVENLEARIPQVITDHAELHRLREECDRVTARLVRTCEEVTVLREADLVHAHSSSRTPELRSTPSLRSCSR